MAQTVEHLDEALSVEEWRFEVLWAAGFSKPLARKLAAELDVDLHRAVALVDAGCPPRLAAEILL